MKISTDQATLVDWSGEFLAVGIPTGDHHGLLEPLYSRFGDGLRHQLEVQSFSGKQSELVALSLLNVAPQALLLIGLGEVSRLDLNGLRQAAVKVASACRGSGGRLGLQLPWEVFSPGTAICAAAEAICLSHYSDQRFRSEEADIQIHPDELVLLNLAPEASANLAIVHSICRGVNLARDLVNAPANSLTPDEMANTAQRLAENYSLELTVLDRKQCTERGMGAYIAVSQGSALAPRFIHLTYHPEGVANQRLCLVGKGLTFDSGGYNLKVGAAQIDMMKYDMGGGAAVLGAMQSLAELQPRGVEIHAIVAACENMINGRAVHPGDIVRASNGTTIEINNTDAEGRLTLADALVYASSLKPDAIVDLATLTGACLIALGEEIAGLWSSDDALAEGISSAAECAGEGLWRMPMPASYREGLKSKLADLRNTGPRPGSSITAALFLKEFIGRDIPWAHLDIAGTVWTDKDRGIDPAGATGFGVRTLVNWVLDRSD